MTRPTIVITAGVAFHGTTARPQHFARGLADRGWNVLYVNPPITWLSPLKNRALLKDMIPDSTVETIPVSANCGGSLSVLYPMASIPFGNRFRLLNRWNQSLLAAQIHSVAPGPYVLLPMLHNTVDLISPLLPVATVYDCVDYHAEFRGLGSAEVINRMEQELVSMSRLVFATADLLADRMIAWHNDVRLLPNAAEVSHFSTASHAEIHAELYSIPEPRVGFIGGIGSWVDINYMARLAQAMPHVQFVFIGPVHTNVSALEEQSNVHMLGLRPYDTLPNYLAGFQATLVCFDRSELSQAVNPIKVYEYIAAGREVVATPIHELEKIRDFLWMVTDVEEGVRALQAIFSGETRVRAERRQQFVDRNSWQARVQELDRVLSSVIPKPMTL